LITSINFFFFKEKQQSAACENQQKQQGMEVDEEKNVEKENEVEEVPLENEASPRGDTLEEQLHKAIAKVYKWMAGIEQNQIGTTLEGWDNSSLLKMVEMANHEIREHPAKFI
jgi:hypothetical protein